MTAAAVPSEHDYLMGLDEEVDYASEPPDLPPEEAEALDLANWHLRSVERIRARRDELLAHFAAEQARLSIRMDARKTILEREEAWHLQPLERLHRALLARDPKRKTITLACGTLMLRAQQPTWEYHTEGSDEEEDTAAFVAWARESHPDLLTARTVGVNVPASSVPAVLEALMGLPYVPAEALAVTPEAPDKAAVKQALVLRDEKGKPLVLGVDPETNERPPGLTVTERPEKFDIDLATEDY